MTLSFKLFPEQRKVVLPYHARLAAVIQGERRTLAGLDCLVADHTVDLVRFLENIGTQIPPPINIHYQWTGPKPFDSQVVTAAMMTINKRAFVLNELGCVDADTEYLSPSGWKRIADYSGGDVAQYHPDSGEIEFVAPTQFVKLPCDTMLRIKTKYGIDQMLSPEHRMLIHAYADNSKQEVVTAHELYRRSLRREKGKRSTIGFSQACIPATFRWRGEGGLPFTDAQIRLMVAVKADGHFPPRHRPNTCHVRVKKQRKKDRLRALLTAAGSEWKESSRDYPTAKGFTVFKFLAPETSKTYAHWWNANEAQRQVIADEAMHWDGSVTRGMRWSSYIEAEADFMQFVYASTGRTARLNPSSRIRLGTRETEYAVQVRDDGKPLQIAGSGVGGKHSNMTWVPSTDGFKYCFMVPSTFLLFRRKGCIFASGNTGKTYGALGAMDYLMDELEINKALIIAPVSTLTCVWEKEIFNNLPHRSCALLYGTAAERLRALAQDVDFYIMNHDGLRVDKLRKELMTRTDIDAVLIDELAAYRNGQAKRWKDTNALVQRRKYVWGMTGAPTPNEPTDAFAQTKLVNPKQLPTPYFKAFRELTMTQMTQFRWVPKLGSEQIVHDTMQPAVRFTRAECVDLPPVMYVEREAPLTKDQMTAYRDMSSKMRVQFLNDPKAIYAPNAGVKLGKLLQIGAGFIYGGDGSSKLIDYSPRLNALLEVIEEAEKKVIVFLPFKRGVDRLYTDLAQHVSCARVYGDTPKTERDRIFTAFQTSADPHVLVAHPQCMSHGLTLTAANTIVWFSPTLSHETYEQANGRVTRPGQDTHQLIVRLVATPAERKSYATLDRRGAVQDVLLELFTQD